MDTSEEHPRVWMRCQDCAYVDHENLRIFCLKGYKIAGMGQLGTDICADFTHYTLGTQSAKRGRRKDE